MVVLLGCVEDKEPMVCPECKVCPTCPKQVCPKQVCEPEIKIKEVIKEKVIKEDCTNERAGWYIKLARDELDGYYEDFDSKRFGKCKKKIEIGEDLILTAVGFYKLSESESYVKAYEDYIKAINYIYSYCDNDDRDNDDRVHVVRNYLKWYGRYIVHVANSNITKEMKI